jgi:hypothetical protein
MSIQVEDLKNYSFKENRGKEKSKLMVYGSGVEEERGGKN